MRFHLIDELWVNNENDKKAIINTFKDEAIMKLLRIEPENDDFILHL